MLPEQSGSNVDIVPADGGTVPESGGWFGIAWDDIQTGDMVVVSRGAGKMRTLRLRASVRSIIYNLEVQSLR